MALLPYVSHVLHIEGELFRLAGIGSAQLILLFHSIQIKIYSAQSLALLIL